MQELLFEGSQNCIVPLPSGPIEYDPENVMGSCVIPLGRGFTSSSPPVNPPLPSATKLPAREKNPLVAVCRPLDENA